MKLWSPLVVVALSLAAFGAPALSAVEGEQPAASDPRPLYPNTPVRASLTPGERPFYQFSVPANSAARIVVEQMGIDVGLIARKPGAKTPEHGLDFNGSRSGFERMFIPIESESAMWTLGVFSSWSGVPAGQYAISLEIVPADDRDRAIASARQRHYNGSEINWLGDGVSYERSLVEYLGAADEAIAVGDFEQAGESIYQSGRTKDVLGDTPAAIELQLKALDLFRKAGRRDREGRVLNRLGDLSRKIGETTDSERYFQQALPIAQESEDIGTVADILNNSALLMLYVGRTEEAIQQLEAAVPLAQQINSANVETALHNNIAEGYARLGFFDKALESYGRAMVSVQRLKLPRRTARNFFLTAQAQYDMGDAAKAEQGLQNAIRLYDESGDRLGKAETEGFLARMYHANGETDRAVAMFEKVVPILHQLQARASEAAVLTRWAEAETDRDEYDSAIDKADRATALYRQANHPSGEQQARFVKARALQKRGRLQDAGNEIAEAIRSVESMRGAIVRQELRSSYLAAMRNYFTLQVELLQQQGQAAAAFEASERGRARTLLEGLAESAAKVSKGVDAQLLTERRQVQAQLNGKENYRAQLQLQTGKSAQIAAATTDIEKLIKRLGDIEARIKVASPSYWALQRPEPVTTAKVQQNLLDDQSALVEYHVGRDKSYAWIVQRGSVKSVDLAAASSINDLAKKYHEALSLAPDSLPAADRDKAEKNVAALGRKLATAIWDPIAASVRGKRVVVVADGALQYVPFAALPTASGQPVLVSNEIVYLPSASVLETIRRDSRPISANAKAAVFADPVFSLSDPRFAAAERDDAAPSSSRAADGGLYGRLRFSRREAEAIAESSPTAFQALDFSASKSTLTTRNLRQYQILHFATHGTLNAEHPELSGLVFSLFDRNGKAQDGFLRLHEIYNLDLNADLVVLSACRTALGREVYGEGLIGLTRGFMYAGASRVVSSVWNVDDRASSLLMSRFYTEMLAKGRTPAAALREAQLSLLKEARWANPHYWAAFGLQGDWK